MSEFDLLVASVTVTGTGEVDTEFLSVESAGRKMTALRGRSTEYFRQTDGGNADRFAARFGHLVLADVDGRGRRQYHVADETNLWNPDDTGRVSRMSEEIIDDMYRRADELDPPDQPAPTERDAEDPYGTTRDAGESLRSFARRTDTLMGRRNMATIATDKYGLRIPGLQHFDRAGSLIACGDGQVVVLGERDVAVRPRKLDDLCHKIVNTTYDPAILDSPPELIKQFIEQFLPEEGRERLIFKLLGHALPGGNPQRYFVILMGGTTSGKTQLISTLQRVLGRYVSSTPATIFRPSKDERPRADIVSIYRHRLVFLAEASKKSWELHASKIKQFTGGDHDPQRALHSNVYIDERPLCMPVVYTNEMPRIIGMDPATKRRVIIPTMNHTISKKSEDVTIKERFLNDPDVHKYLFAALVRGYLDAQLGGMQDVEDEFSLSTGAGTTNMLHLTDFLEWARASERLQEMPVDERTAYGAKSKFVTFEQFYQTYTNWCKTFGSRYDRLELLSFVDFNNELRENHEFTDCKSGCWRWFGHTLRQPSITEMSELSGQLLAGMN